MLKIVIQDDEGKVTQVRLIRDEITVGRKEGNTIRLTERNVSREHARILRNNGTIAVEDLDSYNGVRVNGSRIQGRVGINVSDRIQIGDYLIELKAEGAAVPGETYGDETQPVETMQQMAHQANPSMSSIPSISAGENDATTKMAAPATAMLPAASMAPGAMPSMPPAPAPAPEVSNPARLVVLSTSIAGQEFDLTKPAMVIGRTDDNDVVINHRSISRHHAKVVNEGGRYNIVDLQSSNGVRVNGEEYSKVELRRADMIDLGHVRLRFVEAGEDFVFGRDAQAIVLPSRGGNRGMLYAIIGVVLLGVIAVFAFTRGGSDDEGAQSDTSLEGTETPDTKPTTPDTEDTTGVPTSAKDTQEDLGKILPLLEVARTNIENEEWAAAKGAANKALEIQADSTEAKDIVSKADLELENQDHYKAFEKARSKKNYSGVAQSFDDIDTDSIYKEKARDAHDKMRDDYVAKVTNRAESLARRGKCRDLAKLESEAGEIWQEAADAVANIDCQDAVVRRNTSKPDGRNKPDENTTTGNGGTSGSGSDDKPDDDANKKPTKTYEQLMGEAKAAMLKSQYGKAQRLCDDALELKPRDAQAATLCGLASCNMKKGRQAKKYQAMLPQGRQTMIRQTCLKAGLEDF